MEPGFQLQLEPGRNVRKLWKETNKSSRLKAATHRTDLTRPSLRQATDLLGQEPGNNVDTETSAGIFSLPEPLPSNGKPVVCGF